MRKLMVFGLLLFAVVALSSTPARACCQLYELHNATCSGGQGMGSCSPWTYFTGDLIGITHDYQFTPFLCSLHDDGFGHTCSGPTGRTISACMKGRTGVQAMAHDHMQDAYDQAATDAKTNREAFEKRFHARLQGVGIIVAKCRDGAIRPGWMN